MNEPEDSLPPSKLAWSSRWIINNASNPARVPSCGETKSVGVSGWCEGELFGNVSLPWRPPPGHYLIPLSFRHVACSSRAGRTNRLLGETPYHVGTPKRRERWQPSSHSSRLECSLVCATGTTRSTACRCWPPCFPFPSRRCSRPVSTDATRRGECSINEKCKYTSKLVDSKCFIINTCPLSHSLTHSLSLTFKRSFAL